MNKEINIFGFDLALPTPHSQPTQIISEIKSDCYIVCTAVKELDESLCF